MRRGSYLCAIAACLFGVSPVFSRRMSLAGMDAASIVCLVHAAVMLVNAFLWSITPNVRMIRPSGRQVKELLLVGALGMGSTTFLLAASYEYIPTGTATVLHFLYPSVVTLIDALLSRKRLGIRTLVAMLLSLVGMALLTGGGVHGSWPGILLAMASSGTYTLYLCASQRADYAPLPGPIKMACLAAGSSLLFLGKTVFSGGLTPPSNPLAWSGFFAMVCCACAAHRSLTAGVQRIGAERAAFITLIEPLVSLLAGILVYHESLSISGLIGTGLVLLALLLHSYAGTPIRKKEMRMDNDSPST